MMNDSAEDPPRDRSSGEIRLGATAQARADQREARRAAALRANLSRRKSQGRARDGGTSGEPAADAPRAPKT